MIDDSILVVRRKRKPEMLCAIDLRGLVKILGNQGASLQRRQDRVVGIVLILIVIWCVLWWRSG